MNLCDTLIEAGACVHVNRHYEKLSGPAVDVHIIVPAVNFGTGELVTLMVRGDTDEDVLAALDEALSHAASKGFYPPTEEGGYLTVNEGSVKKITADQMVQPSSLMQ